MNFSGHEMLDAAGLSLTESEPRAELRSAEEGGTERQHWHETATGVGMHECFLQHQRILLEGLVARSKPGHSHLLNSMTSLPSALSESRILIPHRVS